MTTQEYVTNVSSTMNKHTLALIKSFYLSCVDLFGWDSEVGSDVSNHCSSILSPCACSQPDEAFLSARDTSNSAPDDCLLQLPCNKHYNSIHTPRIVFPSPHFVTPRKIQFQNVISYVDLNKLS